MASKTDYYELLGLQKGATDNDIKKGYRKMAKQYHPDANPNNKEAEQKFKEISEAYEVLSDPQKKATYDQYGHAAFENAGAGAGGGGFHYGDMDDIFESFFGGNFGDVFGGGRSRRNGPRRGADLQTNLNITFEESYFGTKKDITLPITENCDTCNGTGAKPGTHAETCRNCSGSGQERVEQQTLFGTMASVRTCSHCKGEGKIVRDPCNTCKGQGRVKRSKTLEVNIPRGIDNGQSIRLAEKGEQGTRGGRNGDLLIGITVQKHDYFERRGSNIYLEIPVSFVQATLGADLFIPTMEGTEKYNIKPGSQSGAVYSIKGKGFPSVKNNRIFGDLIFTIKVIVPTSITERQKELLVEFSKESGEEVKEPKKGIFSKIKDKLDN